MFKIKLAEAKVSAAKKTLDLKNISVKDLVLVDTDTGEDITSEVIAAMPEGVETIDFKITFELPSVE